MKSSFYIGRIMGISIGINYSWFVIFVLITASLTLVYFPYSYPDWSEQTYWITGIITSVLFFSSVLAHELSHSFVAQRSGIKVKSITLFIFGGVARISKEASRPTTELAMAAAGPLSSLALSGCFAVIYLITRNSVEIVAAAASYLAWINLMLAGFNMLPGFPMDGGRVFRSIVWLTTKSYRKSTRIATYLGQAFAGLFMLGGVAVAIRFDFIGGFWLAFIGGFLYYAATRSYRQAMLHENLRGVVAGSAMASDCYSVPPDMTLQQVVNDHLMILSHRCLRVDHSGRPIGIVTPENVKRVPRNRWLGTTVEQAMTSLAGMQRVSPADEAVTVLERMEEAGTPVAIVESEGEFQGIITRENLVNFSNTRSDLGV